MTQMTRKMTKKKNTRNTQKKKSLFQKAVSKIAGQCGKMRRKK